MFGDRGEWAASAQRSAFLAVPVRVLVLVAGHVVAVPVPVRGVALGLAGGEFLLEGSVVRCRGEVLQLAGHLGLLCLLTAAPHGIDPLLRGSSYVEAGRQRALTCGPEVLESSSQRYPLDVPDGDRRPTLGCGRW